MAGQDLAPSPRAPGARRARRWSWNDPTTRAIIYQVGLLLLVGLLIWYLAHNTLRNLAARNITTGFDFLQQQAGFSIGESAIDYSPTDSYGRAVLVGLLNTLMVSVVGIIAATVLGTLLGIGRLARNSLVSGLCSIYIEVMRNIPLLLQLYFWYALVTEVMPSARKAFSPLPSVFISNRGLRLPWLQGNAMEWMLGGLAVAIAACLLLGHWSRRRQEASGRSFALLPACAALLLALPALGWWISGAGFVVDRPVLKGFNFQGGFTVTPEMFALLAGLVTYTAAYIAEVVRSGIQAVNKGQWEAAASIGLSRARVLRFVILPQTMRVVIPPMTSQYLNLVKNSSLAVAIGYPDIVAVTNTILNQTGQAIEGIAIIMAAYLVVSLSISLFMNWYNKRMALVER
ncbi:amino acid ABC transporter permease [Comamonas sp. NLF-1-9]|uniref:amino acid ABC transporter permease n=1 Tax=Comamonas sp. NLF-1-9 TaxID=2853163 RepID=UPI001C45B534|nr:amino acid ABC transporter permease [Comamonas sp. NLF-1-9]QXL85085.1 amino acid ABC transporter permease [Comamonas sp. NLF-1-9]